MIMEKKIENTFNKMRDTVDQYTKVVRQDGALWKSISEIGGDPSWLNDVKAALDTLYDAIDEADMGARSHLTDEEAKPDFLDLDKDGDKTEPMKKAAKDKEEQTNESGGLNHSVVRVMRLAGLSNNE